MSEEPSRPPGQSPNPNTQALQDAALQLLGAARSFLDAAEKVVTDPQAVQQMVGTVTGIAKSAMAAVKPIIAGATAAAPGGSPPTSGIEHIDLGGDDPDDTDEEDAGSDF
ncbi:MAG TPA: hypothetical protein VF855_11175 [Acidimicrobiales bacterium]